MVTLHRSQAIFAGEEKRSSTSCSPEKWGYRISFRFVDRSLTLYARICTTENQMIADAVQLPLVSD